MITAKGIILEQIDIEVLSGMFNNLESNLKRIIENNESEKSTASRYITRKQVAYIFGVTVRTVDSWTQQSILKSYQIGGLILYKEYEIINTPTLVSKQKRYEKK